MKVSVCIGSACHLKGSGQVVQALQSLVEQHCLQDRIEVCGAFCMGQCGDGVSVSVDGRIVCVTPEDVPSFFDREILPGV